MKLDPPPISNENLIKLSLKTATELIDASVSFESDALNDAQKCLSLIEDKLRTKEVWKLTDLISAIELLHNEFKYDVIPFQLRKLFDSTFNFDTKKMQRVKSMDDNNNMNNNKYFTENQLAFFDNVLQSNSSENYLKKDYLLQVIEYLGVGSDGHKIQLLCILAKYALNEMEKHFKSTDKESKTYGIECQSYSYQIYQEIFTKNYIKTSKKYPDFIMSLLWNICSKLMESTTKINNNNHYKSQQKLQLLSHSLTTSGSNKLENILELYQSINSNDQYFNIIHSIAMSLRKRKGDYISDSSDSDNDNDEFNNNDWNDFIQDINKREPSCMVV